MAVDTIANYVCHTCGGRPSGGVIRMRDFLPEAKHSLQYLCGVCLAKYVKSGEIVIRLGSDKPEAAAPVASDTYIVPVTTDDDGSIAVGDIEFRFE
jgi:hypothetical protein